MFEVCRENIESQNTRTENIKKGRIKISSNCALCGSKKWFIKKQEAKKVLLGSTNGNIPIIGSLLKQLKLNSVSN